MAGKRNRLTAAVQVLAVLLSLIVFHAPPAVAQQRLESAGNDGPRDAGERRPEGKAQNQPGAVAIGPLNVIDVVGCSCFFSAMGPDGKTAVERYIFISDATGKAHMNIDGEDLVLPEVGRKQTKDEYGYCSRDRCVYGVDGVKATVEFQKKTRTDYEVNDYDVVISVETVKGRQKVNASGSCGC